METVSISVTEASRNFSDCVNRARYQGTSFILHKGGAPVARIVPVRRSLRKGRELAEAFAKPSTESTSERRKPPPGFTILSRLADRCSRKSGHGISDRCRCHHSGRAQGLDLDAWLRAHPDEEIKLAAITVAELWRSVERATGVHRAKREEFLQSALKVFDVAPYSERQPSTCAPVGNPGNDGPANQFAGPDSCGDRARTRRLDRHLQHAAFCGHPRIDSDCAVGRRKNRPGIALQCHSGGPACRWNDTIEFSFILKRSSVATFPSEVYLLPCRCYAIDRSHICAPRTSRRSWRAMDRGAGQRVVYGAALAGGRELYSLHRHQRTGDVAGRYVRSQDGSIWSWDGPKGLA